jgi:hypothetical protein
MEKFFKYIFVVVYIFAFIILGYLICVLFFLKNENIIAPIAIIISAILASTAMARSYIQNARHEQQKIRRELFDRRVPIIKNIENIVDDFIDNNQNVSEEINALSEQYYLIDLLFEEDMIKLLKGFVDIVEEYKRSKKPIDLNRAVLYYDEYLKFELQSTIRLVDSYKELDEQRENWKNQPKRSRK